MSAAVSRLETPIVHYFKRGDHVELGAALVTELGGHRNVVYDELHAWKYVADSGRWSQIESSHQSRIVQSFAGYPLGESEKRLKLKASDIAGAIKLANDQVAKPGFFAAAAGVAFADCVVRATATGIEVRPHDRENRVRAGYPFAFDRGALPRRFLSFLHDLFRDDRDKADKEHVLQEFGGACILGIATRFQQSMIGVGEGDNGKSALASVFLESMPPGTTSAIAPQDWGQEYRRAMLVGKHLNAVGELPEREILASEAFKAIVAGDPIVGRIIRESPLMFRPIAGHYFAANNLPGTTDQSEGFWRRFVVVTFNRSFKGDPSRDPEIVQKVIAEKPAIVAWMLAGAERLIRERKYTIPASHYAALAAWRKNADQVALFVEEETRALRPSEEGTLASTLYDTYRGWCERNGHRPVASNKLGMRMRDLNLESVHTRTGNRYPVVVLTSADRAERDKQRAGVKDREGLVKDLRPGASRDSNGAPHG